ncbi:MAG: malate synthase [Acidobacteriota bacterium]
MLRIRDRLRSEYDDVFTEEALAILEVMAAFNEEQERLMARRSRLRAARARDRTRIGFLDPQAVIPGTEMKVGDARNGKFKGAPIPQDLTRQWIQGTGPATRPGVPTARSLRNVAYALLSGADGWMFDGEDALGQVDAMSVDNQRNLRLAIARDPLFLQVAGQVAAEMNRWSEDFLGRRIIQDWEEQLGFTTRIFRVRGLHLDDRHVRTAQGAALAAGLVDLALYAVHNARRLTDQGSSVVFYLPKIQTAEEAAFWNKILAAAEAHLGFSEGSFKVYVLVEQVEPAFQLMEICAVLGPHFVGYNTGRWDYINSVSDAMAWDGKFVNPNIESIGMTYGYMKAYEDRVRRAVNTPDAAGNCALWQGGMEPNIPVGSRTGVAAGMKKAVAGAEREQKAGASGKWVAHWKMVHLVRPVWERAGRDNQLGRSFPRLTYTREDAEGLFRLEDAPRTLQGARNLLSVGLQYGNAFGKGMQAAALKPADSFGDDDVLYLMEDMATGEIRLSILWEWVHKGARRTEDDPKSGARAGGVLTPQRFKELLDEEYGKLLKASSRDVHDDSKTTTLPLARLIVERYVLNRQKVPWLIDLLNLNLNNHDISIAQDRIAKYLTAFHLDGARITDNPDFPP